jgi:hypothetical protein
MPRTKRRGHSMALRMIAGVPTHASLVWLRLSPAERLRRSWALRRRLPNLQRVHDEKLFPRP